MEKIKFDLQLFAVTKVPTALVKKAWAKDLWTAAQNELYFSKFIGETPESIIQKKTELKKEKGDKITIALMMKLHGTGVTGDNMLEGNEEAMEYRDYGVTVDQLRHAVRIAGKFEEQKTSLDLRKGAKAGLKTWWVEKFDERLFRTLGANPTADKKIIVNNLATEAAITGNDVFGVDLIGVAKRRALKSYPKMRPVRVNGTNHYVMVIDMQQARDLRKDPRWIAAQESANIRGEKNPIFSGALGMWDNVVIHEAEGADVLRTATGMPSGGKNIMVGHALLLGAQAGVFAVAKEFDWVEKLFDYDNQFGVSAGAIFGVGKSQFIDPATNQASDFAVVNVATASIED